MTEQPMESKQVPVPTQAATRCCGPAEQSSCCEPSAKAACCGDAKGPECGCR
jgi:arsenite methyltransferase